MTYREIIENDIGKRWMEAQGSITEMVTDPSFVLADDMRHVIEEAIAIDFDPEAAAFFRPAGRGEKISRYRVELPRVESYIQAVAQAIGERAVVHSEVAFALV